MSVVPDQKEALALHNVMIRCPNTGESVWTSIAMTDAMLAQQSDDAVLNFRCPACDELHAWCAADAWIDD